MGVNYFYYTFNKNLFKKISGDFEDLKKCRLIFYGMECTHPLLILNSGLCKRNWMFRCNFSPQLSQRNAPGIDSSYLAMDTEEGVEVVWNEVMFSERKSWKSKEVCWLFGDGLFRTKYSRNGQVNFLKAVFHKFYLVHSWILCPIWMCDLPVAISSLFLSLSREAAIRSVI